MSAFLQNPRLPQKPVSLGLISGEYPWLKQALKKWNIKTLATEEEKRLPDPVRFHPDLQVCPFPSKQMFALKQNKLGKELCDLGFTVLETHKEPGKQYPQDVLCGGFWWGSYLVGNPKGIDPLIQKTAIQQGQMLLPVRQGYGACSVALVNQRCAITADKGLEQALTKNGFEVLLIRPGFILLPGYDTGFIGGCCGKLAPDLLAFTGELSLHPDGDRIRGFLKQHGVTPVELRQGPLIDVGGILPLMEKD